MSILQPAVNVGLSEIDFWNMTVAEIQRYIEGAVWRQKRKAEFDYNLANLIGISCARMLSKDVEFPPIEEVYPSLFEVKTDAEAEEAKEQQARTDASVNRFLSFALQHNAKVKNKVGETPDDDRRIETEDNC